MTIPRILFYLSSPRGSFCQKSEEAFQILLFAV